MNGPRTVSRNFNICHFVQLCNCYYIKDQRWVQLFVIWPWFVLLHGRWQMKSFSFQILTQSACALEIDGLLIYVIIWQYIYYGHGQNMGANRRGMIPLWQTGDPKAKCQGLEFRIWTLRYKNFQSTFLFASHLLLSCTLLSSLTKEVVVMRDLSSEHHGWQFHHIPSPLDLCYSMALTRILYGLLCFRLCAFCGFLLCLSSLCDHVMWFM
jgi:hypothetical protein